MQHKIEWGTECFRVHNQVYYERWGGEFATEIFSRNSNFPRNALGNTGVDCGCRGGECKDYGTDVSEDPVASIFYAEDVKQPVLVLHNYQTFIKRSNSFRCPQSVRAVSV